MSAFTIYLIGVANSFKVILVLLLLLSLGGVGFCLIHICFDCGSDCDEIKRGKKWLKRFIAVLIASLTLLLIFPSSKTLVAMYVIPPIVNNEQVQQLPSDVLTFLHNYLMEQK